MGTPDAPMGPPRGPRHAGSRRDNVEVRLPADQPAPVVITQVICQAQSAMQSVGTGSVIAGFRVESLIGEGATGEVYLAEDATRGGRVALKILAPELAHDDRYRERFLRESRLAATLDHPHVVPIVAAGEEDGLLYLAMAYVEGSELRELLRSEGALEPERALDLSARSPRPSMQHTPRGWCTGT